MYLIESLCCTEEQQHRKLYFNKIKKKNSIHRVWYYLRSQVSTEHPGYIS